MKRKIDSRFGQLSVLESKLGCSWKHIKAATVLSEEKAEYLEGLLVPESGRPLVEDATIVFFGSVARGECTSYSDADWIVLVDGQVDEQHFTTYQSIRRTLIQAKEILPGSSGLFGGLAFSHDIVHRIGGEDDTNRNLTLRMLLLLESIAVGDDIVRTRVIQAILRRYLADDPSWTFRSDDKIPRFLLNDCVRFWRTMAVDFADKFHDQTGEKWALRNAKLRFSRKLIFLAAVLACFSWQLRRVHIEARTREQSVEEAQSHFFRYFSRPPLEIVADELLFTNAADTTCRKILNSYDEFLSILNDKDLRDQLVELPRDLAEKNALFQRIRQLSHIFRDGLTEWLFGTDSIIFPLVRDYALF